MGMRKVDFVFRLGARGWTETWWSAATTQPLSTTLTAMASLAAYRSYPLSGNVIFDMIRVSDNEVIGDSLIETDGLSANQQSSTLSDTAEVAGLVRVEYGDRHRRNWLIRGLAKDWTTYSIPYATSLITVACWKLIRNFLDEAKRVGLGARVRMREGETPSTGPKVVAASVSALNPWPPADPQVDLVQVMCTLPTGAIRQGEQVTVKGARGGAKAINGTWVAAEDGAVGSFAIAASWPKVQDYRAQDLAKARAYKTIYDFAPITDYKQIDARSKQTGRPTGEPRGRVRKRV